ncbi:hypothetical protein [Nitriliruptor alkaliphilus]|uniref:hypothetical protein n=1 Tax=Nitriliruptor alkaliphilus TaxID=427918 RepID=UPI000698B4F4|nr:hypothetical protein [Nitriliruptor alkaliphilus]
MSPLTALADAPPALRAPAVVACADTGGEVVARAASIEAGTLRVTCTDEVELVRPAAWLRAAGDGRDAIDVVLRPGGQAVTVTWRDGRRTRFHVGSLRG